MFADDSASNRNAPTLMKAEDLDKAGLALRYKCDLQALPAEFRSRWIALEPDQALVGYLGRARAERLGWFRTALQRLLRLYVSDFDANGLLKAYPMHLLSTPQWERLLRGRPGGRLLDIGAGSGDVTAALAPLFDEVRTVEVSEPQARRLRKRGFPCFSVDVTEDGLPEGPYDAVSCLNLFDRCKLPRTLLSQVIRGLKPGGTLIVALALPYRPAVYHGPYVLEPEEQLTCLADDWERATASLIADFSQSYALELSALARAPYLSGGDTTKLIHELDDLVAVFHRCT